MYRILAIVAVLSFAVTTSGCGEVTTTDARKSFVEGLDKSESFPCKLTKVSADARKLRMKCDKTSAADAAAAIKKTCDSFDRLDMREIRLVAGEVKQKCKVADDCACQ